ncbi:hypothetical protein BDF19DRAFT_413050 [Syncephalis fuscata]|nr:hypothetical protein BDF19DRAFT_413050 [Syncephalis fuscata]
MIFKQAYYIIAVLCTLELAPTIQHVAALSPSLSSGYALVDLAKMKPGESSLGRWHLTIETQFGFSKGLFKRKASIMDLENMPNSNRGIHKAKDMVLRPTRHFRLKNGICYVVPRNCDKTMKEYFETIAAKSFEFRNRRSIALFTKILQGMMYLFGSGWTIDPSIDNICITKDNDAIIAGYSDAERVGASISRRGSIQTGPWSYTILTEKLEQAMHNVQDIVYHPFAFSYDGQPEPLPEYEARTSNNVDQPPEYTRTDSSSNGQAPSTPPPSYTRTDPSNNGQAPPTLPPRNREMVLEYIRNAISRSVDVAVSYLNSEPTNNQ